MWKNTRHDKYWRLAKEQGFRSRAAFKLIQLNKKYNFLEKSKVLIDLCAAPGGWLQVAQKYMPVASTIIGIDLLPIKAIRGVKTFTIDITSQQCKSALQKELKTTLADVILNDGAPNVGGSSWAVDAFGQIELVMMGLRLAVNFLKPGGLFITKVFRSRDYNALQWVLKHFFKKIEATKPLASRAASAEIYVICSDYLAPKKVDPRLLDSRHVFKQVDEPAGTKTVFDKNRKRNRDGYVGGMTQFTETSVTTFIETHEPIALLAQYSRFKFDEKSEMYAKHEDTTEEIKQLCADLKVLGKRDFSNLLKWRRKMNKFKNETLGITKKKKNEKKPLEGEEKEEKEEDKLTAEVTKLAEGIKAKSKAKARKKKELENKQRKRLGMQIGEREGILETLGETDLFSMKSVKGDGAVDTVIEAGETGEDHLSEIEVSEDEFLYPGAKKGLTGEEDPLDSAEEDGDQAIEKNLNSLYQDYKKRKKIKTKKKQPLGLADDEGINALDEEQDGNAKAEPEEQPELLIEAEPTKPATQRWFERDTFAGLDDSSTLLSSTHDQTAPEQDGGLTDSEDDLDNVDNVDNVDAPTLKKGKKEKLSNGREEKIPGAKTSLIEVQNKKTNVFLEIGQDGVAQLEREDGGEGEGEGVEDDDDDEDGKKKSKADNTFEEVPADRDSDWSSDSDAQAETLAMGTLMIRKKQKRELMESGFNRYAFDDPDDIPEWFKDHQDIHNRPNLPVTKEMVDSFKEKLASINARPLKKIVEARARKRMRSLKKWEKTKSQADAISKQEGVGEGDKLRQIEKLYKKSSSSNKKLKGAPVFIVAKKGGGAKTIRGKGGKGAGKGKVKHVDSRMRKDLRAEKRADKLKTKGKPGSKAKKRAKSSVKAAKANTKKSGGTQFKQSKKGGKKGKR